MIPAFPKVFHLGDKNTANLFKGPVEVTEKLDGSQFTFGKLDGHVWIRSKNVIISSDTTDNMFSEGVQFVMNHESKIKEGMIYHGEYLRVPRHNTLEYERIPRNHVALFAVRNMAGEFSNHYDICQYANDLDCEAVPLVFYGTLPDDGQKVLEFAHKSIDTISGLGKAKMEGIVIKNYAEQVLIGGQLLPILCAKYVSEQFKEVHKTAWSKHNPGTMERLALEFKSDARWAKAVQALRDAGTLENAPRDIGPLLAHINKDIDEEEKEYIKDQLWSIFRKDILRIATGGFPMWYKDHLVTQGLNEQEV